jgi:hypothetical protein
VAGLTLMRLGSVPPLVREDRDTRLLEEGILVRLATCGCKVH